jgi:hypothetical protein
MNYLVPVFCLFLLACTPKSTGNTTDDSTPPEEEEVNVPDPFLEAKAWLTSAIDAYFAEDFPKMEVISTEQFQNYWKDQMEVEYGDLPLAVFNEKWGSIYDVERAGIGTGLFIDAQDYHSIKIVSCEPLGDPMNDRFDFQLKLKDEGFNQMYEREISMVRAGDSFLINDVRVD